MKTVNLKTLYQESRQIGPRALTTAHVEVGRFYRKMLQPLPELSLAESVARLPSVFSIWTAVTEVERTSQLSSRSRERFESAARRRVCDLRGHGPGCGCSWSEVRASL
jgi:hypothetical protein